MGRLIAAGLVFDFLMTSPDAPSDQRRAEVEILVLSDIRDLSK